MLPQLMEPLASISGIGPSLAKGVFQLYKKLRSNFRQKLRRGLHLVTISTFEKDICINYSTLKTINVETLVYCINVWC